MASLYENDGKRRIQFVDASKTRRTIYLGGFSKREAERVLIFVERLITAQASQTSPDRETSAWLGKISDTLSDKLYRVGLIEQRTSARLGRWLDDYKKSRKDVKPATSTNWGHTIRNLKEYFGENKNPREIDLAEAERFKQHLIGSGLKSSTVSKRLQNAKMFFRRMAKEGVTNENPFADVRYYHANDKKKNTVINRKLYDRIMEAMPDTQWRAIFALARIGALRCPSEVLSLRWCDIDWSNGWMNVRSPKNEHHVGKESRQVPLFEEIETALLDAKEVMETLGVESEFIVWRPELRSGAESPRGWQNSNLRGRFNNLLKNAGIPEITKPFQSMRSSGENEMVKKYSLKSVIDWVGHDVKVAAKNYLDSEFDNSDHLKATGRGNAQERKKQRILCRTEGDSENSKKEKTLFLQGFDTVSHLCKNRGMGDEGLEPPTSTV